MEYFPEDCDGCGRLLARARTAGVPVVRQVFDVPELNVVVTEHVLHALECGCGRTTRATGPNEASAPAAYGTNVTALAAYLSAQQHLPVGRVAEVLADVAGIEMSTGWITTACRRAEQETAPTNTAIKEATTTAPVAYFDGSATRVNGKNHWMHAAATATLTAYHIDEHGRSAASITAFGILPVFAGVAVHDAYTGFDRPIHALCNARIMRELAEINEFDPIARNDGSAAEFIDLLGDAHRWAGAWRKKNHPGLPAFKAADLRQHWDRLVERGMTTHPPRPGRQTPARNLALRLRDRREEFLHFTVTFSNNSAEQAIRMIKTKTKVSGGFRTLTGAQTFLALRGYISTVRKNGINTLTALRDALHGNP